MRWLLLTGCVIGAASFLGAAELPDSIKPLGSGDNAKRNEALKKLAQDGVGSYDALVEGLSSDIPQVRSDCARLLGVLADTRAIDALLRHVAPKAAGAEGAGDVDAAVRIAAIDALAALGAKARGAEVAGVLLARLNEADPAPDAVIEESLKRTAGEKYALASALATLAQPGSREKMKALIATDSTPALGECAARYFAALPNSGGHADLLAFIDAKKTEGEGENARESWAYGDGWTPVRVFVVLTLLRARHADGARILSDELTSHERFEASVNEELYRHAATWGAVLVPALIDALRETPKIKAKKRIVEERALAALARIGTPGLNGLAALYDEGQAEVESAKAEGRTLTNKYDSVLTRGLAAFAKVPEGQGRKVLLEAYRSRPQSTGDVKDQVRERLFSELLKSDSTEGRDVLVEAFGSSDVETVKKAIETWVRILGGREIEKLKPLATHADTAVRQHLADKLGGAGQVPLFRAQPMLLDLSKDTEAKVRESAWKAFERSQNVDFELLAEFERGMNDTDSEVQFQAARALLSALSGFKLDDDKKKDDRRKVIDILKRETSEKGGSARGIVEEFHRLDSSLFKDKSDAARDGILKAVQSFIDAPEAEMRAAVCKRSWQVADKDWIKRVVEVFKNEKDANAATAEMDALNQRYEMIDAASLPSLVAPAIQWLRVENTEDNKARPADTAARFLGKLGSSEPRSNQPAVFSDVNSALAAELRRVIDAAEKGKHSESEQRTAAACILALKEQKNAAQSMLVVTAMENINSPDVRRNGIDYLEQHGTAVDANRLDKIDGVAAHERTRVRDGINRRARGGN